MEQGVSPDQVEILGKLRRFQALDFAGEVGPGYACWQRLIGIELRQTELEPGCVPIGALGMVLEVLLKVLHRSRKVRDGHAGATHGEKELGAECRAVGQLTGLDQELVGSARVRANQGV